MKFPIHYLQELQEQRGGFRVSALGSAALLHSAERVTAFWNKATSFASSSNCLKTRHVVDVFSEADFGPATRTTIFSKNFQLSAKKVVCSSNFDRTPNDVKRRQTAAPVLPTPSKYRKTRVIVNWTTNNLRNLRFSKWCSPKTVL